MPLDYSLCCNTVTVYRMTPDGVQRFVLPGCGFLQQVGRHTDKLGHRKSCTFLLLVPGDREILPGDRVMAGEGPEFTLWSQIQPLAQLDTVKIHTWEGSVCHREGRGS